MIQSEHYSNIVLCKSQVIRVASNNKHNVPYNIASYATLALILEKITGHKALGIQGDLKKVHLYDNSLDAVKEQLSRDINKYDKCELKMDTLTEVQFQSGIKYINEIEPGSFKLVNYESYPHIKVEMLERDK